MIRYYLLAFIPISLITSYILLDEIQQRTSLMPKRTYVLFLSINAVFIGIMSLFNYPIFKTVFMIIWNLGLGKFYYHHSTSELIYDGSFALCIGVCELMILPIIQFINLYFTVTVTNVLWFLICSMLIVQLIVFYMYHFYRKMRYMQTGDNTGFAVLNFILLPIFSFVNILIISSVSQFYMYTWILIASILDIAFIIFLNLYLSYIYHSMMQSQQLQQELALYEQKSKMQYAYYQKLEENYEKSRQMIHDVKRHLQMLLTAPQNSQYKDDFQAYLNQYAMPHYSNHHILNMIIYEKMQEAHTNNIEFTCETALLDLHFMKELDITTIFLNLLDNAMDACKECKGERFLRLKADTVQDFLVIEIVNSIMKQPKDSLASSKKQHEGLGLKNVSQALESYGGNMQVEFDESNFTVHLYIPMK